VFGLSSDAMGGKTSKLLTYEEALEIRKFLSAVVVTRNTPNIAHRLSSTVPDKEYQQLKEAFDQLTHGSGSLDRHAFIHYVLCGVPFALQEVSTVG
jgi:hypothetical protein